MRFETGMLIVLSICLALLAVEVAHTRWCDYCQAQDVRRSRLMCVQAAQRSGATSPWDLLARYEQEYNKLNLRRKKKGGAYLPKHLVGISATTLIERAAA